MSNEVLVYEAIQALKAHRHTNEISLAVNVDLANTLANMLYSLVIVLCVGNPTNTRELHLYHDWLEGQ